MRIVLIGLVGIVLACSSKNNNQNIEIVKTNKELSLDEPKMKRAVALAQDSLPFFVETFNKFNNQVEFNFFIKSNFSDGKASEHMWARPFKIMDTEFKCLLDANPLNLPGYKFNDTVKVSFSKVEDFMIILGDSVIGNYQLKELQKVDKE